MIVLIVYVNYLINKWMKFNEYLNNISSQNQVKFYCFKSIIFYYSITDNTRR